MLTQDQHDNDFFQPAAACREGRRSRGKSITNTIRIRSPSSIKMTVGFSSVRPAASLESRKNNAGLCGSRALYFCKGWCAKANNCRVRKPGGKSIQPGFFRLCSAKALRQRSLRSDLIFGYFWIKPKVNSLRIGVQRSLVNKFEIENPKFEISM